MNGHKKTRACCLLFVIRLWKTPSNNNRTTARACTIWDNPPVKTQENITCTYQAQAFTVHYSIRLKNFPDFYNRNNLRKMLTIGNKWFPHAERYPLRNHCKGKEEKWICKKKELIFSKSVGFLYERGGFDVQSS